MSECETTNRCACCNLPTRRFSGVINANYFICKGCDEALGSRESLAAAKDRHIRQLLDELYRVKRKLSRCTCTTNEG